MVFFSSKDQEAQMDKKAQLDCLETEEYLELLAIPDLRVKKDLEALKVLLGPPDLRAYPDLLG